MVTLKYLYLLVVIVRLSPLYLIARGESISNLPNLIAISDAYGTLAGVGGNTDIKKGHINLIPGQQEYDLDTLFSAVSESGKRIEVVKVFHEPVPAINRFFDPYSVSGQGTLNLIDEFGFGSYSPAAQFVLMPVFEDLLRIQAIEFNDQFRKSAFTFNIVNGTIAHDVSVNFKASSLFLHPAHPGTGIIAGGSVRKMLAVSGITDIIAKQHGAPNGITNARVAMKALSALKPLSQVRSFAKAKTTETVTEAKTEKKAPAKKAPAKKKAE